MPLSNKSLQEAAPSATLCEVELDRITALAASVFHVPICVLVLLNGDQLWVKSSAGTDSSTWPVSASQGHQALFKGEALYLLDATQDAELAFAQPGNDTPTPLHFFASAPLRTTGDHVLGALVLLDWQVHPGFGEPQMQQLLQFAGMVQHHLVAQHEPLDAIARATQERLQLALDSAQMGTWDFDFQTKVRIVNHRTAMMLGYETDTIAQSIDSWLGLVHPDDRYKIVEATQIYRKGLSDIISIEYRIRHQAGHDIWVQSYGKLVERDHRGRPKRVVGTLRDITEQKRREAAQHKQRQLLDLINQAHATFLLNRDIKDACEALFAPLLQISESQFGLIGVVRYSTDGAPYLVVPTISQSDEQETQSPQSREYFDLDNLFGKVITSNKFVVVQQDTQDDLTENWPEGLPALNHFICLPIRFDNDVVGVIGLGSQTNPFDQDVVDLLAPLTSTLGSLIHARQQEEARIEAEQEWLRLATEDTLTGLPNRRHFFDVAETCLLQTKRYGNPMTIALLDLDNFKQINDTYGHGAGDEVLRVLADILRQTLRDSDTPSRIGGEEFAVMLTSTPLTDSLIALERIRATLSLTPITMGQQTLHATVSIGAVQWNEEEHENIHTMLLQADAALYQAKRRGRNRVEVHHAGVEPFEQLPESGFGLLGLA